MFFPPKAKKCIIMISKRLTLPVSAYEAPLLQTVVVVPVAVGVHLHAVLLGHLAGVEDSIGLTGSPVEEAQRRHVRPGPAD